VSVHVKHGTDTAVDLGIFFTPSHVQRFPFLIFFASTVLYLFSSI